MVCPDCGAGARDDANYCLNCGATLDSSATSRPDAGAPTERIQRPSAPGPRSEAAVAPELTDCANCGAPNSARRQRCGRCGADLETGRPSATPVPRPRPRPETEAGPPPPTPRRTRVLPWIIAVGIVVGAAIGGLAAAEVGPFAAAPAAVPPTFDPDVYPDAPRPLDVAGVLASSTQEPQGDNRYDAELLFDGDATTAWNTVGASRPDGVGETLRIRLSGPSWVSDLVIANGYQKDDRSFVANARVRTLRVSLGERAVFDVGLLDQPGRQVVNFAEPVLARELTLRVLESYPGETYDDLAVSELEVRGWTAVGADAERLAPGPTPPGEG